MRLVRVLVVLGLSGVCIGTIPHSLQASSDQAFDLKPCEVGRGTQAECGVLLVPENRATKQGRRIGINIVVLRASMPGAKVALFLLAGGPGQGSTSMTGTATGWMAPLRETMDVVLMDQRGTGGSNPLACETEIAANPARSLDASIDRMLAHCNGDPACQQAQPNLSADLEKILARLDKAPARAMVSPTTGAPVSVTMTRGDFLYAVRGMLYAASASADLPPMISQAATTGNLSPFAQRYWSRAMSMGRSISYGAGSG
jgi:hypothetical protein